MRHISRNVKPISSSIFLVLCVCLSQTLVLAQTNASNLFFSSASSTISAASIDTDLQNYDSNACLCDVSYECDYDCACEGVSTCDYTAATSRKTTLENHNTLIKFPHCDSFTSSDAGNKIIPNQMNSITCLAFQNTPYHGDFYNVATSTTTTTTVDVSTATFPINIAPKNLSKSSAKAVATGVSVDTALKTVTGFYASDQFGICLVQAYFGMRIESFSSQCVTQTTLPTPNRSLTVTYVQTGTTSGAATPEVIKTTPVSGGVANDVKVSVTAAAENVTNSASESGYTYGDIVTFGDLPVRFGGSYYSSVTFPTFGTSSIDRIKRADVSTSAKQVSVTIAASTNYFIYYTTLDNSGSIEFQIVKILAYAGKTDVIQIDFIYVNYIDIAETVSYSDRLNKYIRQFFYPLKIYLFGDILQAMIAVMAMIALIALM